MQKIYEFVFQALREWQNNTRNRCACVVKGIKDFVGHFLFVFCHQRLLFKSNGEEKFVRESDLIIIHDKYDKPLFAMVEDVKQRRCVAGSNGKCPTIVRGAQLSND